MNPRETPARDHVAEKSLGKHWTVGSTNLHVALVNRSTDCPEGGPGSGRPESTSVLNHQPRNGTLGEKGTTPVQEAQERTSSD